MGTCIGKRNLKYFISFLFMTALHAFITASITIVYFTRVTAKIDEFDFERSNERMLGLLSIGVGLYAGVIGLTLLCFGTYSLWLLTQNITSNENLRTRWNAKRSFLLKRRRERLNRKANEQMSPEEMEEQAALRDNDRLEKSRQSGCCAKLSYFFCK